MTAKIASLISHPQLLGKVTSRSRYGAQVTLGYVAAAVIWMALTDGLPLTMPSLYQSAIIDAAEDAFFVIVTAALLYTALLKAPDRRIEMSRNAEATPEAIFTYGFACLITLAMSVVVKMRADSFGDPQLSGLMLLPVMLSAFLGGGGPGVAATVIGAATIGLLVPPPLDNSTGRWLDGWFLIALFAANGLLVSSLSEMLLRSRRTAHDALESATAQFEFCRKTEASLKLIQAAFQQSHEGMVITATNGTIVAVNPATCLISGFSSDELIGSNMRLVKSGRHDATFYRNVFKTVAANGFWQGEVWNRRKSGDLYPQWLTISAVKDDAGKMVNYVGTFADISAIKQSETTIDHITHHDSLTDLPNRLMLTTQLSYAINRAKRDGNCGAALMVDLDHFKKINDSLGHAAGDELLQIATTRMLGRIRQCDMLARLGGDEFMVVLEGLDDPLLAGNIAQTLIAELKQPYTLSCGHEVFIGASIGICIYPNDSADPAQVIRNADAALHEAKSGGRSTCRFYTRALTDSACQRLDLEARLRKALLHQEFVLHFQPLSDMSDLRVLGTEALIRWLDPVEGMISPARFIPLAEETGLIVEIGTWVLRSACHQMKEWLLAGSKLETIAVNLSPKQFHQPDLVEMIRGILAETGLAPHHLELEITEGTLMDGGEECIKRLAALKALGVRLAIDDFGTGYSSLAYLKRFPVDKLKVDQAFVRGLCSSRADREIVSAVITLGKALDLEILAEGIETEEQLSCLRGMGCDTAQGFLLGRPVAARDFAAP